jgi:hypothetical protein
MQKIYLLFLIICCVIFTNTQKSFAQGNTQVITFTGVVIDGDSVKPVKNVNLYIYRANRACTTNEQGIFSMTVKSGDTVVITRLGYDRKMVVIPQRSDAVYSVVIDLKQRARVLPVVEVHPYSDEKVFKEVFLALKLPERRYENMAKNLNKQRMTNMAMSMPMDGSMNYKFYMQQQTNAMSNVNGMTSIPLLNPFAWAEFIKSIKRGDLKRNRDDD